mgnify:FL=1
MRYTEVQVTNMTNTVKTLPPEERVGEQSLFEALDLLRRHAFFTVASVLERHYGLGPALTPHCPGLQGACRFSPGHLGDCDVVF